MSDTPPPIEVPSAAEQIHAREAAEAHQAAERTRLEAEVARRRREAEIKAGRRRGMAQGVTDNLIERLRARSTGERPDDTPYGESPEDTLDRLTVESRRLAWTNSLAAARIGEPLVSVTLDQLDASQHPDKLRGYVEHLRTDGVLNLVLAGPVGSGKTAAAIAAGSYAAEQGRMVRIVRHGSYLAWLRPEGAGPDMPEWKVRKRFRDADLVILDDLGATLDRGKEATRAVREETLGLIGDRIESGLGTIITTNEPAAMLETMLGERVMSRIADRGRVIKIEHADRRRTRKMTW